jgi:hypothetical protein
MRADRGHRLLSGKGKMMASTLTHVVFKVAGEPPELAAFDARLKLLFAEHAIGDEVEEQHTDRLLHYDLKVAGGIPFPPFALASADFPGLAVMAEWVDLASGVRGAATIVRGELTQQKIENVIAAGAEYQVAIRTTEGGYLALALAAIRTGPDEWRGYMLTGKEDALFKITRQPGTGMIELVATAGAAEWSERWRCTPPDMPEYQAIAPAQPLAEADFSELEKVAQDFVKQWIWFGNGPREEIAIEAERYSRLGYTVSDANLRSAAMHRIGAGGNGPIRYSSLDASTAWIENAIAGCWPVAPPG